MKVCDPGILSLQRQIALICEMWHTSSLLHDDVIDHAETRRGKMSVNCRWNPSKSIFAGDFILGTSAKLLAQTGNPEVTPDYTAAGHVVFSYTDMVRNTKQ